MCKTQVPMISKSEIWMILKDFFAIQRFRNQPAAKQRQAQGTFHQIPGVFDSCFDMAGSSSPTKLLFFVTNIPFFHNSFGQTCYVKNGHGI
jgi:hypothetical protein